MSDISDGKSGSRQFRVLKTLGGCGGTIIARALAANNTLVLSEVNPRSAQLFSCKLNPLTQMENHYYDLVPRRWRDVDPHVLGVPSLFGEFIADLHDSLDVPLIIRDYSYIDYIGVPFIWPEPTEPSLPGALAPFGESVAAMIVRHPCACYKSLLSHPSLTKTLSPDDFVQGHLRFYKDNHQLPLIRFEDFLVATDATIKHLCHALQLPFREDWRSKMNEIPPLTGSANAVTARDVEAMPTRPAAESDLALRSAPRYKELLALGGYD